MYAQSVRRVHALGSNLSGRLISEPVVCTAVPGVQQSGCRSLILGVVRSLAPGVESCKY